MGLGINSFEWLHSNIVCYCAARHLLEKKSMVHSSTPDNPEEEAMRSLRWYDRNCENREQIAEEVRADAGESEFGIAESLRLSWIPDQRADPAIRQHFDQPGNGFRVAPDGVLERHVDVPPPIGPLWVPIVPRGHAMAHVSWKRWCVLQVHVGILSRTRK